MFDGRPILWILVACVIQCSWSFVRRFMRFVNGQLWVCEISIAYEKLNIVLLPPRITAKHQLLYLGIIANAKIRYRSALICSVLGVIRDDAQPMKHCYSTLEMGNMVYVKVNCHMLAMQWHRSIMHCQPCHVSMYANVRSKANVSVYSILCTWILPFKA